MELYHNRKDVVSVINKKKIKKGFTLVELLAVIVVLAIILVIAVPQIMSTIEESRNGAFASSAKLIASSAETLKLTNDTLGIEKTINCPDVAEYNSEDYQSCSITFDEGEAQVTLAGKGKFAGKYVCAGTRTNAVVTTESCTLVSLTVDPNEGTNTAEYEAKYEAGSKVTLTEPTREGYTFNGWEVTGTNASVNGNELTIGTTATTVKAKWEKEVVPPVSFSTDDWETIVAAVESGNYPYTEGNTKTVDLGTLGVHTLRVANTTPCSEAYSESDLPTKSQSACGFVLEFVDIITKHNMNPSGEYNGKTYSTGWNKDGWPGSEMYKYVNETIYNALPEGLRNAIIKTKVISSYGIEDTSNFESEDYLYLLSPEEVYGTSFTHSYDKSRKTSRQLDYYAKYEGEGYKGVSTTNYEGAIKKNGSDASSWWLRSAVSTTSIDFYLVATYGGSSGSNAYSTTGVSPAFRLSN